MSIIGRAVGLFVATVTNVYATWNPSDKSSHITLSGGNLTATTDGTASSVRSTIGKSSGKWYWEVSMLTNQFQIIGIQNATASLNQFPGGDANGWGYYGSSGSKYNGAGAVAYGATFTAGDVIGVALDMTAGTIIFYKNNSSQGTAFTGLTGTQFAAIGDPGAAGAHTANFGASAFTYTPPAGYNAGLY